MFYFNGGTQLICGWWATKNPHAVQTHTYPTSVKAVAGGMRRRQLYVESRDTNMALEVSEHHITVHTQGISSIVCCITQEATYNTSTDPQYVIGGTYMYIHINGV